jgi:hypothetical protein
VNISGIEFELRFCSSRSGVLTVGSGVLEDGMVSSDSFFVGFSLVVDGLHVISNSLGVHVVGMSSGSGSFALVIISGIMSFDSSGVSGNGSISSFVSGGFRLGSFLSGGVSGVEFFMGFVLFVLNVVELVLSFGEKFLSRLELRLSLVPG